MVTHLYMEMMRSENLFQLKTIFLKFQMERHSEENSMIGASFCTIKNCENHNKMSKLKWEFSNAFDGKGSVVFLKKDENMSTMMWIFCWKSDICKENY